MSTCYAAGTHIPMSPGAAEGGKLSPGLHGAHGAARESRGTPAPNTSASEITFATDVS